MRLVADPAELAEAVQSARSEAASAFGDGTVFLERFVTDPRHVEVQILGDTAGTVVHLFERECSIQRRYQKIVEECPSPAVDADLRAALAAAAVTAGQAIGYTGAGTVEFVLDRDGSFYFLEMNTRLQVEHPVTEEVTGLDLVELQLRIAEGEPLPLQAREAQINGHAIEVRLYAEDVPAGFVPATGTLHRFAIPAAPGIRVETGFRDGSVVSPHYDAMLAKVIAHGRTRADAARRLARALERAEIHGVTTNRDLLVAILREPDFLAGATDTGYLTRHDPAALAASAARATATHALAAALARQARHRAEAPVLGTLPSGWRNVFSAPQRVTYTAAGEPYAVAYRITGSTVQAWVNDVPLELVVHAASPDRVDLEIDGTRRVYRVHQVARRHVRRRQRRLERAVRGAAVRRSREGRARRVAARPDARPRAAGPGRGRRGRHRGSAAPGPGGDEDGADRQRTRQRRGGRTARQGGGAGQHRPGPGGPGSRRVTTCP